MKNLYKILLDNITAKTKPQKDESTLLRLLKSAYDQAESAQQSKMLHAGFDGSHFYKFGRGDDAAFRLSCRYGYKMIAQWLWSMCSEERKISMLHAADDDPFCRASENGHYELVQWLWSKCSEEKKISMLHAQGDVSFSSACMNGHLEIAKWLWNVCPEQEQTAMLHAKNNSAFRMGCQRGQLETLDWLWSICPKQEQSAMLHAQDDWAFGWACHQGHLETVKWLLGLCKNDEEQKAMLHAKYRGAFRSACQSGHQEVAEYLWGFYSPVLQSMMLIKNDKRIFKYSFGNSCTNWLFDQYAADDKFDLFKWICSYCIDRLYNLNILNEHRLMTITLWSKFNEFEQKKIINDPQFQHLMVMMINTGETIKDIQSLITNANSTEVRFVLNNLIYQAKFEEIINIMDENPLCSYSDYLKGCKSFSNTYFINCQLDHVVRTAIKKKNKKLLSKMLNSLDPLDLLDDHKLEGWLQSAEREGDVSFKSVYVSSVWRSGLNEALKTEAHFSSLNKVLKVLFKRGVITFSNLFDHIVFDAQLGGRVWWCSTLQAVVIDMLNENPKVLENNKLFWNSFFAHPLLGQDLQEKEYAGIDELTYKKRCLHTISWFESELEKEVDGNSQWNQKELYQMVQRLNLGCNITFGDDDQACIKKIKKLKHNLRNMVDVLEAGEEAKEHSLFNRVNNEKRLFEQNVCHSRGLQKESAAGLK